MNKRIFALVLTVLMVTALGAYINNNANKTKPKSAAPKQLVTIRKETTSTQQLASIKPIVKSYKVNPNLSNIENRKYFIKNLNKNQIDLIVKNGFVASPTDYTQLFEVYENNEYQRPQKYPAFITVDTMLHTYHLFYDYSLRKLESDKLFDALIKLSNIMEEASKKDYQSSTSAELKEASRKNMAYFAVAQNLLTGAKPPKEVEKVTEEDIANIRAHAEIKPSSILGYDVVFTQFNPRGHYTRSENLKKFFCAMMWYGNVPLPLPGGKLDSKIPTIQSLLITENLYANPTALKLWDMIYEPTVFYVGKADDHTAAQYKPLIDKVFGKDAKISSFANKEKLNLFIASASKLPGPKIEIYSSSPNIPTGPQFRFMGQRFIPDSRILQELSEPKASGRKIPMGLDVPAALGSDRALSILKNQYKVYKFSGYEKQMAKMRAEILSTPLSTWQSNLYWGWLWSLEAVVKPAPVGYPSFMRNEAWQDKSLFTALGSWTELRHDTILYAKQSMVAECGGDEEEEKIIQPKGYVEPNLEFWTRLKWLNDYTKVELTKRTLLSDKLKDKFEMIGDLIDFCRRMSIKELTNKPLTKDEYDQIENFGAELDFLFQAFAEGDLISDADKDMAIVADVHTYNGIVLEEATGRVAQIFVVVPIEGKLYLTRGAIYTHYEFTHPASDRLTDEKWQSMLKTKQLPDLADWIKSFYVDKAKKPSDDFESSSGGC